MNKLLEAIACFPTTYTGPITPDKIFGVGFVSSKLHDRYNWEKNKLERHKLLPQNYFKLIAECPPLIGFDKFWILAGIRDYIEAFKNPNPKDLTIYKFNTDYLVFAPVSRNVQENILTWLYQNRKLYDERAAVGGINCSSDDLFDFEKLFPVKVSNMDSISFVESTVLTQQQLDSTFYEKKMIYPIMALDPIRATFAAYCTMENTNFDYPIIWNNSCLEIYNIGYILSEDLRSEFNRVLAQITNVKFKKISGVPVGKKCFYCDGDWYAPEFDEVVTYTDFPISNPTFELFIDRDSALNTFKKLGYKYPESEPILTVIPVEYEYSNYYYKSSSGKKISILHVYGDYNSLIHQKLQTLSNTGYFLTKYAKNIHRNYPNLILSTPCFSHKLSSDPKILLQELQDVEPSPIG